MIAVEHLTKCYGTFCAVDDLSFTINEGHVYGFLGPNGAGKSTTMNIITGCLSATEGQVKIDGYDIFEEPGKAKRLIGYLPEQPPLYLNESVTEYLAFVGKAKGLRREGLAGQMREVISQTGIEEVKNKRISTLSKGYRQRVGIAQALLGSPKVIILDEPTVGLDPIQIIEIRDLIKDLGRTHTVIFSSHILSEVQAICDRVLIIARGRLIAFDEPGNLEKQLLSSNAIRIATDAGEKETAEILSGIKQITDVEVDKGEGKYTTASLRLKQGDIHECSREVFFAFARRGKALLEMTLKKANLEDIFIELTEDRDNEAASTESVDGPGGPGEREVEE